MRKLTLHEKISFKGKLVACGMGFHGAELIKLNMKSLRHYWNMFYYMQPLINCFNRKIKRK